MVRLQGSGRAPLIGIDPLHQVAVRHSQGFSKATRRAIEANSESASDPCDKEPDYCLVRMLCQ